MTNINRETIDTWLYLLDDILLDAEVDGSSRQQGNIARLRADMLRSRPAAVIRSSNEYVPPSEPQMSPPEDPLGSAMRYNEAINHDNLPPMKRLNTKVKTLDVSCPTCKAKPNKRCFRMSNRGPNGVPTDEPLVMGDGKPSNHKSRTKRAQEASS